MTLLEGFDDVRTELADSLETMEPLLARHGDEALETELHEIRERLAGQRFVLVVIGEFKRGKTTFLNSLIGEEVLPTAVVPLTSTPTILEYGPEKRAWVHFLDGSARPIAIDAIADYGTERGNPNNVKGVERILVAYPSEFLRDGIELVDTPGVGSVYAHNTRAAEDFLPRADAGIFVVTVDPPISEGERRFLEEARPYLAGLFFVQNKIDQVPPDDQAESLAFTRTVIEEVTGKEEVTVYPLSAREALRAKREGDPERLQRSGMPDFEAALSRFLAQSKGDIALRSAHQRALRLTATLSNRVRLQREALRTPLVTLEQAASAFERELGEIRRRQGETKAILVSRVRQGLLGRAFEEDREAAEARAFESIASQLRQAAKAMGAPPRRFLERLNEITLPAVEQTVIEWQAETEARLKADLNEAFADHAGRVNEIIARVLDAAGSLFGVRLESLAPPPPLDSYSRFFMRTWSVRVHPGEVGGLWLYLLPRARANRRILREVERNLAWTLGHHMGSAGADLRQRALDSANDYLRILNDTVTATTDGIRTVIRQALDRKVEGEAAVASALVDLDEAGSALADIETCLRSLSDATCAVDEGETLSLEGL